MSDDLNVVKKELDENLAEMSRLSNEERRILRELSEIKKKQKINDKKFNKLIITLKETNSN
ncbi:hypothetical protein [Oceanobacillus sp. FSL H7-0719]|uniref:hypothetical protein n=1 Tax=Oceanobacillus sp. FSL H7-0719 TaxID=2954507 RepID=UPI003254CB36